MYFPLRKMLLILGLAIGTSGPTLAQEWSLSLGRVAANGCASLDLAYRSGWSGTPMQRSVHKKTCCTTRPGYYKVVAEKVWVPGCSERVWVPARYETRYTICGQAYQHLVSHGHYRYVQTPGRYETVSRQVWVPASTVCTMGGHARATSHGHYRRAQRSRGITVHR